MPRTPIPQELAAQALEALKQQFSYAINAGYEPPELCEPGQYSSQWTIAWEDGPFEWVYRAFVGGLDPELYYEAQPEFGPDGARAVAVVDSIPCPQGVHAEPANSWCLALYPEW